MAGKAELDKMDIPFGEEVPPPETAEETPVEEARKGRLSSWGRKVKMGLFGVAGCLLISGIAMGIWSAVCVYQEKEAAVAREKAAAEKKTIAAAPRLVFQDFLVPLPVGDGYRILLVNFVAELGKNKKQNDLNGNAGVRRQVINAIQLRRNELLSSVQGRELLKKDLVVLMNQILGEGAVTGVYLTDFTFI